MGGGEKEKEAREREIAVVIRKENKHRPMKRCSTLKTVRPTAEDAKEVVVHAKTVERLCSKGVNPSNVYTHTHTHAHTQHSGFKVAAACST